jgi:putative transposase
LAAWLLRWQEKYQKLCAWVEENIKEPLTFYRLPRRTPQTSQEHEHVRAAQPGGLSARTHIIRIFSNGRALCASFER